MFQPGDKVVTPSGPAVILSKAPTADLYLVQYDATGRQGWREPRKLSPARAAIVLHAVSPPDLYAMTAKEAIEYIKEVDNVDRLADLEIVERAGRRRKSVLGALDARRNTLSGE